VQDGQAGQDRAAAKAAAAEQQVSQLQLERRSLQSERDSLSALVEELAAGGGGGGDRPYLTIENCYY
jgi:hypothetical protein